MVKQQTKAVNSLIYYRLIALWALAEAMLGGIIHGFKIPVSGLVVGSCAIICICLIAWYVPAKGSIIKATIIVAVFKMLLSPQSPPPAYIAVFFQGLLGELLFWNRRLYRLSCIVLAVLGLLESGLQRILTLTIIYGTELWTAINDFFNGLTKQKTTTNYSFLFGAAYVFLHLIVGLAVGWLAGVLPHKISIWRLTNSGKLVIKERGGTIVNMQERSRRKRKGLKTGLFVMWILLIGLYIQSYFQIGKPLLPPHISLKILIRSFIIVMAWYFVLAPLLRKFLHKWLQIKREQSKADIRKVVDLLPDTRQLVVQSWKASEGKKGWARVIATVKMILVNSLQPPQSRQVTILTGHIHTGKTSSLIEWCKKRINVSGILTPVINGNRSFLNIRTRERFAMEAEMDDPELLAVGRFMFSKKNFLKAIQVISDSKNHYGWLVIDEIGPMELRGEGFCDVLRETLASENNNQKILMVVREGLVEEVKEYFHIQEATVISNISQLS
jgi:nucleoside-triphosphatase THEP1/ABC-type thiamin/hydroxymethylpyrimidine transport system permease subunit